MVCSTDVTPVTTSEATTNSRIHAELSTGLPRDDRWAKHQPDQLTGDVHHINSRQNPARSGRAGSCHLYKLHLNNFHLYKPCCIFRLWI
jgi:hypothetical protein